MRPKKPDGGGKAVFDLGEFDIPAIFHIQFLYNLYVFVWIRLNSPQCTQLPTQFYTDIVNSAAFDTPVAFLEKYGDIDNYGVVVESEEKVRKLMCQIVGKNIEKASQIVEYLNG